MYPNYTFGALDNSEVPSIKLYDFKNYSGLLGILSGGYYLHNMALPILRNSKYPENNLRDLFFGYCLVFCSYVLCGGLGYIGFQQLGHTVDQNCLNMLPPTDVLAIFVRFCVFL